MTDFLDRLAAPRVFVRVYRLPEKLTDGYCFGGGTPITMTNVDWFEASVDDGVEDLVRFIKSKRYFSPNFRFLVIGDHPDFTFTMNNPEVR